MELKKELPVSSHMFLLLHYVIDGCAHCPMQSNQITTKPSTVVYLVLSTQLLFRSIQVKLNYTK